MFDNQSKILYDSRWYISDFLKMRIIDCNMNDRNL